VVATTRSLSEPSQRSLSDSPVPPPPSESPPAPADQSGSASPTPGPPSESSALPSVVSTMTLSDDSQAASTTNDADVDEASFRRKLVSQLSFKRLSLDN